MKQLLLIATIVLFISTGVFAFLYFKNREIKASKVSKNITLDSSFIPQHSITYRDSEGIQHVVVQDKVSNIISQEATKAATQIAEKLIPVAEELGVKPNQLISGTEISLETLRDSIKFLKRELNTANQLVYSYKDKYLSLNVKANPFDTADLGTFDMKYDVDLKIAQYWKRNKVLGLAIGSKQSFTDISSSDPRTTVMGVKKYTVVQPEPQYGLRIQAVGSYNNAMHSFSVGPGARFDLGFMKGSLRGSYLYNTQTNKWGWSVSVDKDLIRF